MEKLLNVFSNEIGFDIDFITNPTGAQISVLKSEGNHGYGKTLFSAFVDGQTDAVHCHRTFGD
jgi:hypothetical protein